MKSAFIHLYIHLLSYILNVTSARKYQSCCNNLIVIDTIALISHQDSIGAVESVVTLSCVIRMIQEL